ncbi:MAG: hypothetical protein ACTHLD_13540 [Chitinophaga sp.]
MEILISIVGVIIAWITLVKTFYSEPTEEKENLLLHFLATQKLSKEVSTIMTDYATRMNAFDVYLYTAQKITYRAYINGLIESQHTNLSDELFQKLKNSKLTKSNIASMQRSIEAQFEDLQKMKHTFLAAGRGINLPPQD